MGARQSINLYALRLGPEGIRVNGRSRFSVSSRVFAALFDTAIIVPIAFENLANSGVFGALFIRPFYPLSKSHRPGTMHRGLQFHVNNEKNIILRAPVLFRQQQQIVGVDVNF